MLGIIVLREDVIEFSKVVWISRRLLAMCVGANICFLQQHSGLLFYTCILGGGKLRVRVMARIPLCLTSRIQDREWVYDITSCIWCICYSLEGVRNYGPVYGTAFPICLTPSYMYLDLMMDTGGDPAWYLQERWGHLVVFICWIGWRLLPPPPCREHITI